MGLIFGAALPLKFELKLGIESEDALGSLLAWRRHLGTKARTIEKVDGYLGSSASLQRNSSN